MISWIKASSVLTHFNIIHFISLQPLKTLYLSNIKKEKIVPLRADSTLGVHVVLLGYGETEHAQTLHSLFFFTLHLHHLSPEGVLGNFLALQTEALGLDQVVQGPGSVQVFHAHLSWTLHGWPKDAFLQELNVSTIKIGKILNKYVNIDMYSCSGYFWQNKDKMQIYKLQKCNIGNYNYQIHTWKFFKYIEIHIGRNVKKPNGVWNWWVMYAKSFEAQSWKASKKIWNQWSDSHCTKMSIMINKVTLISLKMAIDYSAPFNFYLQVCFLSTMGLAPPKIARAPRYSVQREASSCMQ